jgi:general secretion pathway protein H
VLVVLVILGIVGGLVLARGPQRSAGLEMRAASGAVAQALRTARSRAIGSNRPVTVLFDTGARTLQVGATQARSLPQGIAMSVETTADQPGIEFQPDGSSSGGQVELANNGRRILIGVDWISGRVSVAEGR